MPDATKLLSDEFQATLIDGELTVELRPHVVSEKAHRVVLNKGETEKLEELLTEEQE